MSLIPNGCIEYNEVRKICVAEEKGKKYTLINDSGFTIQKIRVDGCISQQPGEKRCDYLFKLEKGEPDRAVFVELKGGDLIQAIRQVTDTINYLGPELSAYKKFVRIIGSRDVQRLRLNPAYSKLIRLTPSDHFEYATNGNYSERL
jgi:hypothetical protein